MILNDEHLADIRQRKNRFIGQWTGTAGSLAADCHRLMEDRNEMAATIDTLQQDNQNLRRAVEARLAANETACCDGGQCHPQAVVDEPATIPVDWILRGEAQLKAEQATPRFRGDSIMTATPDDAAPAAEQLLLQVLDVIRERRLSYGGPRQHFKRTVGMINAAFGDILTRPLTESDWAQIMILDKIARFNGQTATDDGPIDVAGYAGCWAEVRTP